MTVLEAIKQAVAKLESISVPVKQMQAIGAPLIEAVAMLQASVTALETAEQKEEAAEEEAGE